MPRPPVRSSTLIKRVDDAGQVICRVHFRSVPVFITVPAYTPNSIRRNVVPKFVPDTIVPNTCGLAGSTLSGVYRIFFLIRRRARAPVRIQSTYILYPRIISKIIDRDIVFVFRRWTTSADRHGSKTAKDYYGTDVFLLQKRYTLNETNFKTSVAILMKKSSR